MIHLCIHLYKEASNAQWVYLNQDINLIKFCDVREYVLYLSESAMWDADRIIERAEQLNAGQALFYTFYYLYYLYGDSFAKQVLQRLDREDEEILNQYTSDQKSKDTWKKDFKSRFFSVSNVDEVEDNENVERYRQFWFNNK